jgi:hypothetical protein
MAYIGTRDISHMRTHARTQYYTITVHISAISRMLRAHGGRARIVAQCTMLHATRVCTMHDAWMMRLRHDMTACQGLARSDARCASE